MRMSEYSDAPIITSTEYGKSFYASVSALAAPHQASLGAWWALPTAGFFFNSSPPTASPRTSYDTF